MQVHRVVVPGSRVESWTVLGDDGVPVAAVEAWLAYLSNIGRSPNTVKAYAHDLKDFWVFIVGRGLDWRAVRLDDLGEYVAWLALPPGGRDGGVAVLPSVQAHVSATTVNRKLAALAAFYAFQARRAQAVLASVLRLQLGTSTLVRALLWGVVNWWADVGCLVFAMRAAGITGLSVGKILLVWTAGAGAASLSPTPAGIGAVEVAMVAALAAAGVKGSHAVTAILVYRAISLKGAVTIWALLYRHVYQRRRRTRT
jgi:hypothetical protein